MQILATALLLQVSSPGQLPLPTGVQVRSADLVLTGGRVVAVDDEGTIAEAIAVDGDRILGLGTAEEMAQFITDETRVIELEGRLAIPGFIEGHAHFFGVGDSAMQLDLRQASSWREIVGQVEAAAKELPKGALIRGRGWHQEKLSLIHI